MRLSIAPINVPLVVRRVSGEAKLQKHLVSLGIVLGASVTVLSRSRGGALIEIKGSRLALSRDVISMIAVS